jgi:hypothetical protein
MNKTHFDNDDNDEEHATTFKEYDSDDDSSSSTIEIQVIRNNNYSNSPYHQQQQKKKNTNKIFKSTDSDDSLWSLSQISSRSFNESFSPFSSSEIQSPLKTTVKKLSNKNQNSNSFSDKQQTRKSQEKNNNKSSLPEQNRNTISSTSSKSSPVPSETKSIEAYNKVEKKPIALRADGNTNIATNPPIIVEPNPPVIVALSDQNRRILSQEYNTISVPKLHTKKEYIDNSNSIARGYSVTKPKIRTQLNFIDFYRKRQQSELRGIPSADVDIVNSAVKRTDKVSSERFIPVKLYSYSDEFVSNRETANESVLTDDSEIKQIPFDTVIQNGEVIKSVIHSPKNSTSSGQLSSRVFNIESKHSSPPRRNATTTSVPHSRVIFSNNNNTVNSVPVGAPTVHKQHTTSTSRITSKSPRSADAKASTISRSVKSSNIKSPIEKSSGREELDEKFTTYSKLLDNLVQDATVQFDDSTSQYQRLLQNTMTTVTSNVSDTVNKTMMNMDNQMKQFYNQFQQLQDVTLKTTKSLASYKDVDQKIQRKLNNNLKQVERLSKQVENIEKKTIEKLETMKQNLTKTAGMKNIGHQIWDMSHSRLDMNNIKPERLKQKPTWSEASPLNNLEFYRSEQRVLLEELVGKDYYKSNANAPAVKRAQIDGIISQVLPDEDDEEIIKHAHSQVQQKLQIALKQMKIIEKKRKQKIVNQQSKRKESNVMPVIDMKHEILRGMSLEEIRTKFPQLYHKMLRFSSLQVIDRVTTEVSSNTENIPDSETIVEPIVEIPRMDIAVEANLIPPAEKMENSTDTIDLKMSTENAIQTDYNVSEPFSNMLQVQSHKQQEVSASGRTTTTKTTTTDKNGKRVTTTITVRDENGPTTTTNQANTIDVPHETVEYNDQEAVYKQFGNLQHQIDTIYEKEQKRLLDERNLRKTQRGGEDLIDYHMARGILYVNRDRVIQGASDDEDERDNEYERVLVQTNLKEKVDLFFEEQADNMINRVVQMASGQVLTDYLSRILSQSNIQQESEDYDTNQRIDAFDILRGALLSPDILQYCIDHDIPVEIVRQMSIDMIIEIIKSIIRKDNTITVDNSELKVIEQEGDIQPSKPDETDIIDKVILMLLRMNWRDQMKKHAVSTETESERVEPVTVQTQTSIQKLPMVQVEQREPEKVSVNISIQTEEEKKEITKIAEERPPVPVEEEIIPSERVYLGFPHANFFLLSDGNTNADTIQYNNIIRVETETAVVETTSPVSDISPSPTIKSIQQMYEIQTQTSSDSVHTNTQTKLKKQSEYGVQTFNLTTVETQTSVEAPAIVTLPPQIDSQQQPEQQHVEVEEELSDYYTSSDEDDQDPYDYRRLLPVLQPSEVERRLRMAAMRAYRDEGLEEESSGTESSSIGISTISSQNTMSTYSSSGDDLLYRANTLLQGYNDDYALYRAFNSSSLEPPRNTTARYTTGSSLGTFPSSISLSTFGTTTTNDSEYSYGISSSGTKSSTGSTVSRSTFGGSSNANTTIPSDLIDGYDLYDAGLDSDDDVR